MGLDDIMGTPQPKESFEQVLFINSTAKSGNNRDISQDDIKLIARKLFEEPANPDLSTSAGHRYFLLILLLLTSVLSIVALSVSAPHALTATLVLTACVLFLGWYYLDGQADIASEVAPEAGSASSFIP